MDRIINVKVGGNYLSKDNKNAGVRGEGNVTTLRIAFDEGWKGYAKTITFWDARGNNPVKRLLTTDLIENIAENTEIYLVPIPVEPMAIAGELTFVIDGFYGEFVKNDDGEYEIVYEGTSKRQRSVSDKLVVKDAPITDNAGEPTDPMPTAPEQWQMQVDNLIGEIQGAVIARDETKAIRDETKAIRGETKTFSDDAFDYQLMAADYALKAEDESNKAEQSAERAEKAVGKTSYIGENGNWYAWDVDKRAFYDTGVKAQAGSTVYLGDNPPAEADVWINPNGNMSGTSGTSPIRAFVNILGGNDNWIEEEVFDSNNNVIGTRYGQTVNVNNAVVTPYSKVDLQITSEQVVVFHEKDLAFVAENDDGVVTIYCVGSIPQNDYTIQAIVTEVVVGD